MDIYRQVILDHYKHPHHFGNLKGSTVSAHLFNTSCGDSISMELVIDNKTKTIVDVGFTGTGCAISIASASMLTDYVLGKQLSEVQKLKTDDITALLGTPLTPSRIKCAVLPLEVVQKAIANTV